MFPQKNLACKGLSSHAVITQLWYLCDPLKNSVDTINKPIRKSNVFVQYINKRHFDFDEKLPG